MAVTAFLVTTLPLLGALAVNFLMLLFLLYTFTFEYATHPYMPYILSYLFLLFISPVNAQQLPMRLLGMLVGAAGLSLNAENVLFASQMQALQCLSPQHILFLQHATKILVSFRDFLLAQAEESALLNPSDFSWSEDQTGMNLSQYLTSIHGSLLHMTDPDRRTMYHTANGCCSRWHPYPSPMLKTWVQRRKSVCLPQFLADVCQSLPLPSSLMSLTAACL